jgi:hypothetical protein
VKLPAKVALPRKDRNIPRAKYLAITLQIIAARNFALPSLMQKLRAQVPHRSRLFDLHVAEKAESFANRARDAKFPGRQLGHVSLPYAAICDSRDRPNRRQAILKQLSRHQFRPTAGICFAPEIIMPVRRLTLLSFCLYTQY